MFMSVSLTHFDVRLRILSSFLRWTPSFFCFLMMRAFAMHCAFINPFRSSQGFIFALLDDDEASTDEEDDVEEEDIEDDVTDEELSDEALLDAEDVSSAKPTEGTDAASMAAAAMAASERFMGSEEEITFTLYQVGRNAELHVA